MRVDHVGNDVGGESVVMGEFVDDGDQFREGGAAIGAEFVAVSLHTSCFSSGCATTRTRRDRADVRLAPTHDERGVFLKWPDAGHHIWLVRAAIAARRSFLIVAGVEQALDNLATLVFPCGRNWLSSWPTCVQERQLRTRMEGPIAPDSEPQLRVTARDHMAYAGGSAGVAGSLPPAGAGSAGSGDGGAGLTSLSSKAHSRPSKNSTT